MPIPLLAYFVVEALAFFLVAKAIGVGWALLAIFVLMIAGGAAASMALRNSLLQAAHGRSSVGKLAGDSALLIGGWTLSVIPGFVTSLIGLPLVFGPTRALIRKTMTKRARRRGKPRCACLRRHADGAVPNQLRILQAARRRAAAGAGHRRRRARAVVPHGQP
ncbi:UPF0716 family protein affecting phage T7 exclusion [Corynebacterium afermentans]